RPVGLGCPGSHHGRCSCSIPKSAIHAETHSFHRPRSDEDPEHQAMGDKKRWHDHRWNVVRGAERPRFDVQHNSVVVRVKEVNRPPKVKEPDGKRGEGPAPGDRGMAMRASIAAAKSPQAAGTAAFEGNSGETTP